MYRFMKYCLPDFYSKFQSESRVVEPEINREQISGLEDDPTKVRIPFMRLINFVIRVANRLSGRQKDKSGAHIQTLNTW